jgi:hypothetical protein
LVWSSEDWRDAARLPLSSISIIWSEPNRLEVSRREFSIYFLSALFSLGQFYCQSSATAMDNSEYLDVMIKAAVRQLADDRQPLTSTSLFNLLMRTLANRLRFATTSGRFFALNCTENTTEVLMDVEVLRQTRSVLIGSGQTMLAALIMSVTEIFQAFSQGPDYVDLFRFLKLTYKYTIFCLLSALLIPCLKDFLSRTELEDAEFQRLFDFSLNKMKNDQTVDQIDGRFVFQDFVVSQSQCFKVSFRVLVKYGIGIPRWINGRLID